MKKRDSLAGIKESGFIFYDWLSNVYFKLSALQDL